MNYRVIMLFLFMTCWSAPEKKMVLVIPSYNNAEWYKKNLDSVFSQNYDNWHIIYIDDCSNDGTADLVRAYVKEHDKEYKVTVIQNTDRKGALANHFRAVHMCDDWDIVCQLDGDDWFAHNDVLSLLNETYEDQDVWLTYGSFIDWPDDRPGYSKPVSEDVLSNKKYRETYWTPGQLRTFYAWLFKKIKLEDFVWDHYDNNYGKFYPAACDLAFSYPLMEMAGKHFKYIKDIVYIHNVATQINDFKVNRVSQVVASNILLFKKKYETLEKAPDKKKKEERKNAKKVDVMVFSNDPIDKSLKLLDSCHTSILGMNKLFFIDFTNSTITEYDENKVQVSRKYPSVRDLLLKEIHNWWKSSEYVLFLDSRMKISEVFDLNSYVKLLEGTHAYGYFPSLRVTLSGKNAPFSMIDEKHCVWRLSNVDRQWMRGPSYFNVLIHKEFIRERITYLDENLIRSNLFSDLFAPGMLMIQNGTIPRIGICGISQHVF